MWKEFFFGSESRDPVWAIVLGSILALGGVPLGIVVWMLITGKP